MGFRVLVSVLLVASVPACGLVDDGPTGTPDPAVGTYDKQAATPLSANCGGTVGSVVNGVLYLRADNTWSKLDVAATPGGSAVCGFVSGMWVRDDATTLTLTPAVQNQSPVQITIVGDDLTFPSTSSTYKRR